MSKSQAFRLRATEDAEMKATQDTRNESSHRTPLPITDMESHSGNASLGTEKAPRFDSPVTVRVISYRNRPHDPDGVSVKAVLDAIVRIGLLADDSTKQVKKIIFESFKSKEERTLIEITDF